MSDSEMAGDGSKGLARMAWATVIAVVFLIFVGGIVRSSGAGLGCPDWPKCWGQWWPPANLDDVDLPTVLEQFQKNNRAHSEADLIRLFDPVDLWVEYINRLIGVLIGFFVIGTVGFAAAAVRAGKVPRVVLELAFLSLVLVGFNGWLGASVVRSNLDPTLVTAHLACAFFLLAVLIYIALVSRSKPSGQSRTLAHLCGILTGAIAVQVIIGSQVRGKIDTVKHAAESLKRGEWLSKVGLLDHAHRFFSWVVVFVLVMMAFRVFRGTSERTQKRMFVLLALSVMTQFGVGVGLAYGGLPAALQALHVGIPGLIVCFLSLFWFACARLARAEVLHQIPPP